MPDRPPLDDRKRHQPEADEENPANEVHRRRGRIGNSHGGGHVAGPAVDVDRSIVRRNRRRDISGVEVFAANRTARTTGRGAESRLKRFIAKTP